MAKTKQLKTALIAIRMTETERGVLLEAAERENLSVSTWLRVLGLRAAEAGRLQPIPPRPKGRDLLELQR